MLVNIQTTSERADKKVWVNNGPSGSNSDVVIANENSLDLAFIYPLKCLKKNKKKQRRSYHPNTGQQGYQQGCQQGRELSVSVVLVEQLKGGQRVMVLEQRDKQFNSREFSTTEISLQVSRLEVSRLPLH